VTEASVGHLILISELDGFPRKICLLGVDQSKCLKLIAKGLHDTSSEETLCICQHNLAMAAIVEDLA
jgi:hypothetical protein